MGEIGNLWVSVGAKTSGLNEGFRRAEDEVDGFVGRVRNKTSNAFGDMGKMLKSRKFGQGIANLGLGLFGGNDVSTAIGINQLIGVVGRIHPAIGLLTAAGTAAVAVFKNMKKDGGDSAKETHAAAKEALDLEKKRAAVVKEAADAREKETKSVLDQIAAFEKLLAAPKLSAEDAQRQAMLDILVKMGNLNQQGQPMGVFTGERRAIEGSATEDTVTLWNKIQAFDSARRGKEVLSAEEAERKRREDLLREFDPATIRASYEARIAEFEKLKASNPGDLAVLTAANLGIEKTRADMKARMKAFEKEPPAETWFEAGHSFRDRVAGLFERVSDVMYERMMNVQDALHFGEITPEEAARAYGKLKSELENEQGGRGLAREIDLARVAFGAMGLDPEKMKKTRDEQIPEVLRVLNQQLDALKNPPAPRFGY